MAPCSWFMVRWDRRSSRGGRIASVVADGRFVGGPMFFYEGQPELLSSEELSRLWVFHRVGDRGFAAIAPERVSGLLQVAAEDEGGSALRFGLCGPAAVNLHGLALCFGPHGCIAFRSESKPRPISCWKATSAASASSRFPAATSSPKRAISAATTFSKSPSASTDAARGARFVGKSCSGIGCASHRHSPLAGLSAGRPLGPKRNKEKVSRISGTEGQGSA